MSTSDKGWRRVRAYVSVSSVITCKKEGKKTIKTERKGGAQRKIRRKQKVDYSHTTDHNLTEQC